ncbi:MAG: tryptophan--tRNA ligase [Oscillospiraceae bacterium]|jgi:tryptophanyl-tRNA synthetase|nr:tryptophan--tRNA ligase [Oscillospiraceae bacterium]
MTKRVFSGIQPSGIPTLGNYFGALRSWKAMQDEYDCVYSVVDLHALTQRFDPDVLRSRTRYLYALLLAAGIDAKKSAVFVQSHVPQHCELTWILNCYTMFGELSRMTQFKDKSQKQPENINAGLFDYPVLMAADILLYDSDAVPVGQDQKQHVEIARDIAERFNSVYGGIFIIPQPMIPKIGGKVLSLLDPSRKMDKSDPLPGAYLSLADSPDEIMKKCKRAVTDSGAEVRFDPVGKPGVSNLIGIYALCTGKTTQDVEKEFEGKGYGVFKPAVGEAVNAVLDPIRRDVDVYLSDGSQLDALMREGALRAKAVAEKTLTRVRRAVGLAESAHV